MGLMQCHTADLKVVGNPTKPKTPTTATVTGKNEEHPVASMPKIIQNPSPISAVHLQSICEKCAFIGRHKHLTITLNMLQYKYKTN